MTEAITDHNVAVLKELAALVTEEVPVARDSWVHGFVVGIALHRIAPETALALRRRIEAAVVRGTNRSAEEVEVYLRQIAELFNRSLDE